MYGKQRQKGFGSPTTVIGKVLIELTFSFFSQWYWTRLLHLSQLQWIEVAILKACNLRTGQTQSSDIQETRRNNKYVVATWATTLQDNFYFLN